MKEERYEIIKLLGKGRTGGVYEAQDSNLGRKVALRRFFAQENEINVDTYQEEFEEVAQSLSVLQHPNLLRVYDAGVDGEGAYIISQLLTGENLNNHIATGGAMPYWEVNDMAQQMLDALSTAHEEGYVHGAITPGSILLSPRARGGYLYVILDMGLSKLAPLIQGKDSILANMADPAILAPELFDGGVATVRGDLYMLGQILYMSLAGGHPFGGVPASEAQKMHQAGLPPIQQYVEDVPEDFRLWLEQLVQIDPDNRPESAVEALNTLPKVRRPARNPATAVHSATAQPNAGTSPQPQSPANAGFDPRQTTGVIQVAPNTVTSGVGVLSLPPAKKDPKKLMFIGLGVLALVGAISITMIFYKKNAAKVGSTSKEAESSTYEETTQFIPEPPKDSDPPQKPNPDLDKKPDIERKVFQPARKIITHFDATKSGLNKSTGWQYVMENKQSAISNNEGWLINNSNPNGHTGIKFPINSYKSEMFEFGWRLTYVVRPIKGRHRFGFSLDEELNPGWKSDGVGFNIELMLDSNNGLKVFAWNAKDVSKYGKSIIVPYNGEDGWYTIVVEQGPKSKFGAYSLYVDGKPAFSDTINEKSKFLHWDNHLFSSSISPKIGGNWAIKELKLEIL